MSEHNITVEGGTSVRLPTAGNYCDRDIIVTAIGGGDTGIEDGIIQRTLTEYTNDRVTSVGASAFHSFAKLAKVILPKVKSLDISVFNNCTALASIEIPLVESTGVQTFYACNSLTALNMPSLKTLGAQSVRNCKKLAKVDLASATSIAALCFDSCASLNALIIRTANICALGNTSALTNTPIASGTGYIYVPSALIESYKAAANWSSFATQFRAIEDYPDICG